LWPSSWCSRSSRSGGSGSRRTCRAADPLARLPAFLRRRGTTRLAGPPGHHGGGAARHRISIRRGRPNALLLVRSVRSVPYVRNRLGGRTIA
jgi:hypothetical protein